MKKLGMKFYDKEALSYREAKDLFDPSEILVYLVDEDDSNIARPQAIRMSQGIYFINIDEDILVDNKTYQVVWVYDIHPGCPQIVRQEFIYNETPPVLSGFCRIYGTIEKNGFPSSGDAIFYSTIKGNYSSHFSQGDDKAVADCFGEFSIYLKYNTTGYIVIPAINDRKLFVVPAETSKAYDDLVSLQTTVVTDSFGNPVN